MSKTYTFPQLNLLSGTFDITIITSQGSGSAAVSEKYFSTIEPLVKETEIYGGLLRHDAVRFAIDFDKDNYFRDTIFASFADNEGWVDILVQSNGVYQFYGTIDATTISYQRFYVDYSTHESISFDAHWVIRRLEQSKVEDLEDLFSTADCLTAQLRAGAVVQDYAYLFRVAYVFEKIFALLKTITGLTTVNISFLLSTPHVGISKNCFAISGSDVLPRSDDSSLLLPAFDGQFDNISLLDFYLLWKYTDGTKTNTLWDEDEEMSEQSFYNKDNVYEILIDMIKSFGFILTIDSITATQLNVVIKDRTDGSLVIPTQMIGSGRTLLTTEYLESITTSPRGNNTSEPNYEFLLKTNFGSSFSYTTAFKTEYITTYDVTIYKNHIWGVRNMSTPSAGILNVAFALRDIVEGSRYNSNWDFSDANGLTGWTTAVTNGATVNAVTSSTDNHTPGQSTSGCVQIVSPVNVSESVFSTVTMKYDVTSIDHEFLVVFWVKFPTSTGHSILTLLEFSALMYDSSDVLLTPENPSTEYYGYFSIGTFVDPTISLTLTIGAWHMVSFRLKPKKGEIVKYVVLKFKDTGSHNASADITVRIDDISIYRSHQYFHQMLGRKLQRYYSKPNSKLINRYSGIVTAACGDSILDNGDTFYIKKIAKDYQENETEIEAINY